MTNFEKIKDMSVEELAAKCRDSNCCLTCPIWDFCLYTKRRTLDCLTMWREWLKSEVEE